MTIDTLYNWLIKKYGDGEIQPFLQYDRMVKEPIRIEHLLENEQEINDLYFKIKNTLKHKIVRTDRGTIVKGDITNSLGVWDHQVVKNSANNVIKGIIITVIIYNHVWVFKCGRLTNKYDNTMSGAKAFAILTEELEKDGINIKDYEEDNGIEYKEKIEKYPIINVFLKKEIDHVNHIDLNQAWPSALATKKPEFEKTFSRLDKKVLNSALGYMQSRFCGFKLAKLPMIGINDTNQLIEDMSDDMIDNDFVIVGYNTDGIWYYDKLEKGRLYKNNKEGKGLHHWKHDYIDVKFYAHSDGQYYIIHKNGKIEYKLRGYYQYEVVKPRKEWSSIDDFFNAIKSAVEVSWDDNRGLVVRSI